MISHVDVQNCRTLYLLETFHAYSLNVLPGELAFTNEDMLNYSNNILGYMFKAR